VSKLLVDITFNACPNNLKQLRDKVKIQTVQVGCSDLLVQQLALVIDEACANVIRHAYCGNKSGAIRLVLTQEANILVFQLRDYAPKVDHKAIKPRNLDECRPGGLGINFIDSVMDEWEFKCPLEGPGNVLRMTKRIE